MEHWHPGIIHGLRYGGWTAICIIAIFLLFLIYGNLPNRWYHVLYMYSGSMAPALDPGDLIIITPPTRVLEPGMILTMRVDGKLVTHRLLGISSDGLLITKGDANNTLDDWNQSNLEIGGIVRGRIPYLGYLTRISQVFAPDCFRRMVYRRPPDQIGCGFGQLGHRTDCHASRSIRHIHHRQPDCRGHVHSFQCDPAGRSRYRPGKM